MSKDYIFKTMNNETNNQANNQINNNLKTTQKQFKYWKAISESQQQNINGGWPNVRPKLPGTGACLRKTKLTRINY